MAHLDKNIEPGRTLSPQEQSRVIAMVSRMSERRKVPTWAIWTALYRYVAQQVWQIKEQQKKES